MHLFVPSQVILSHSEPPAKQCTPGGIGRITVKVCGTLMFRIDWVIRDYLIGCTVQRDHL